VYVNDLKDGLKDGLISSLINGLIEPDSAVRVLLVKAGFNACK